MSDALNMEWPRINNHLAGKQIESAWKDGNVLMLRLTTGQEVQIGWYDGHCKLRGEPRLECINVNVNAKLFLNP